ncbi:MAG: hypothetical protein UDC04_07520 [Collinsella bouchesdurhonensis]|nr:hypothetical protein [Collinsella bouchesdurhonensis]
MAKVQDRRRGLDRNSDMERWGGQVEKPATAYVIKDGKYVQA